jgi:hypothetical protein
VVTPYDESYRYLLLLEAEDRHANGEPIVFDLQITAPHPDRRDLARLVSTLGGLLPGEPMPDRLEALLGREHLVEVGHRTIRTTGEVVACVLGVVPLIKGTPPIAYDRRVVPFVWLFESGWPPRLRSWWFLTYGEEILHRTARVSAGTLPGSSRLISDWAQDEVLTFEEMVALVCARAASSDRVALSVGRSPARPRTLLAALPGLRTS